MKYPLLFMAIVFLGGVFWLYKAGFLLSSQTPYEKAKVSIRGNEFLVNVADTPAKKAKGLSGRKELAAAGGMLFVFEGELNKSVWMKDMLIPIDILWINKGEVIGFEENVQPEPGIAPSKLIRYRSPGPVDQFLEVAAGTVKAIGIMVGDKASVSFE